MLRLFVFICILTITNGWELPTSAASIFLSTEEQLENSLPSEMPSFAPTDASSFPSSNMTAPNSIAATIIIIIPANMSEAGLLLLDKFIQFTLSNTTGIKTDDISISHQLHRRKLISDRKYNPSTATNQKKGGKISTRNAFYRPPTMAPEVNPVSTVISVAPSNSPVLSGSPIYGWRVPTPAPLAGGAPTSVPFAPISDSPSGNPIEAPSNSPVLSGSPIYGWRVPTPSPSMYPSINGIPTAQPSSLVTSSAPTSILSTSPNPVDGSTTAPSFSPTSDSTFSPTILPSILFTSTPSDTSPITSLQPTSTPSDTYTFIPTVEYVTIAPTAFPTGESNAPSELSSFAPTTPSIPAPDGYVPAGFTMTVDAAETGKFPPPL